MPLLECAGEDIAYSVVGQGPAVLLLHSMGGGAWVWDGLCTALASRHTVIAFDAPGHGASSYRQKAQVERYAEIAADLIARTGVGTATVVGVSMGGHAALRLADRYPDRVNSLVVANHSLGGIAQAHVRLEAFRSALVQQPLPQFARAYAMSRMKREPDQALVARYADSVCAMAEEAFIDTYETILNQRHHREALQLTCPVTVIASDSDVSSPLPSVQEVALAIPGAAFVVLRDANHFAYLDQPQGFNDAVLEHLRRLN